MKIHEYQAKELFRAYQIAVPDGFVIENAKDAQFIGEEIGFPCVVKAQIHAGGRGKAGGVKVAQTAKQLIDYSSAILGMKLVSQQTGEQGKIVKKVLIEQGLSIKREIYLAILIDRSLEMPLIIASTAGGTDIEEIAANKPELILSQPIHPFLGIKGFQLRQLSSKLNLNTEMQKQFNLIVQNLYRLFLEKDASLIEINPLIITANDQIFALDAKMSFDDNALSKHSDILGLRDINEEDLLEIQAAVHDLNYIKLDGNIGCMVNGAGLAMATMDILHYYGGKPANFLDVGGGTSTDRIAQAMRILLSDGNVKVVFVNIFGGIVRTDDVAKGIVSVLEKTNSSIPMVIRLIGTNEQQGRQIIEQSGLNFIVESDFSMAAQKATRLI
jgi:succinyl-CoA synthetase beta subunit